MKQAAVDTRMELSQIVSGRFIRGLRWRAAFRPPGDSIPARINGDKAKPSAHLRAALTPLTGRKCLALIRAIALPKRPPF